MTGVCVVGVAGELDALTAPTLTRCVSGRLAADLERLVIDLGAVEFLGSAGLGALIEDFDAAGATLAGR
jgi:anti-anti-sigma factor